MTVCILGASLDVGNRGVRALAVSLADLFARTVSAVTLAFHYGNETGGRRVLRRADTDLEVQVLNCRMSPRSSARQHIIVILFLALLYRFGIRGPGRRNPWLRSLLAADVVGDIRGGDSFSDIYGFRRFLLGSLPLLSVVLLGRPYVLLPQTYGPFGRALSRRLASLMLRRAHLVLTRDRNCETIVRELSGRTPRFCPDVAFTLEPVKPATVSFAPEALDLACSDGIIGINVSGLLYMGGYTGRNMFGLRSEYRDTIDQLLEAILLSSSVKVLLVPHVFGSEAEEEACASLLGSTARRHPRRVFMLTEPLSEREVKWVIGRTHFFIGSRMHACIAALSQYIPSVGLAYSDKFLGVFESAGVGDAILDLRIMDSSEVVKFSLAALERRAELAGTLRSRIRGIQAEISGVFREITTARTAS